MLVVRSASSLRTGTPEPSAVSSRDRSTERLPPGSDTAGARSWRGLADEITCALASAGFLAESTTVHDVPTAARPPVNWGLLGLVGLSVEFWFILGALVVQHLHA